MPLVNERGLQNVSADIYSKMLDKRHIFLQGVVDGNMASYAIPAVIWLSALDPVAGITLMINSPGGSVSDGIAIYETIRTKKLPYSAVVTGMAASMAAVLTVLADHRVMTKYSRLMLHAVSTNPGQAKYDDLCTTLEEIKVTQDTIVELIQKRVGDKVDVAHYFQGTDKWLSADEALELGFIDEIL